MHRDNLSWRGQFFPSMFRSFLSLNMRISRFQWCLCTPIFSFRETPWLLLLPLHSGRITADVPEAFSQKPKNVEAQILAVWGIPGLGYRIRPYDSRPSWRIYNCMYIYIYTRNYLFIYLFICLFIDKYMIFNIPGYTDLMSIGEAADCEQYPRLDLFNRFGQAYFQLWSFKIQNFKHLSSSVHSFLGSQLSPTNMGLHKSSNIISLLVLGTDEVDGGDKDEAPQRLSWDFCHLGPDGHLLETCIFGSFPLL